MNSKWWRLAWPWLLLLAVAVATAWLRYGLIESASVGQQCGEGHGPWWCSWRQLLVLGFLHNVYGIAAIVATVIALLWKRAWAAWLAAALGVFALELYCFETGALALLIGSLRLLRVQAMRPPPVEQHRQREQQVQAQP